MASVNAKVLPESVAAMALFAGIVVYGNVVIRPDAGVDEVQLTRAIGAAQAAIR